MSSRILRPNQLESAEPLQWRNAGDPKSATAHGPPASSRASARAAEQAAAAAHGPSWDEYRALETRLREVEAQLPVRERQGHEAGRREAETAASAKWDSALERATRSVADAASFRGRLRREAEQDVIRLSVAMARRILHRELTTDQEALLGLVRTALERLDLRETHRVRVRPEDAEAVAGYLKKTGCPDRVEVIPDSVLERGGLLFETERGTLDASADTQLAEIERGFADLLDRRKDQ